MTRNSTRPSLFLSYAREDGDKILELSKRLESDGFTVWMDMVSLTAGRRWEDESQRAIQEANVILVFLSRTFKSTGVQKLEITNMLSEARINPSLFIIPVRLEDCEVPSELASYQSIDYFPPDGYEILLRVLYDLTQQRAPSDKPRSSAVTKEERPKAEQVASPLVEKGARELEEKQGGGEIELPVERSRSINEDIDPEVESEWVKAAYSEAIPGKAKRGPRQRPAYQRPPFLKRGLKGEEVRSLQERLRDLGFDLEVDGSFGQATHKAVTDFQLQEGLNADGIVGPSTSAALAAKLVNSQGSKPSQDPEQLPSSKEGLAEEARERNALNDKPIDDVDADTLGFKHYVFALRDFIASQSTTTPLTISVNGAWGSGKSSLMQMLRRQLEPGRTHGLWWIQTKWLAGWLRGTLFCEVGKALVELNRPDSEYIQLGLAFHPEEDITKDNFEDLLGKYIDYSLKQDIASENGESIDPNHLAEERQLRLGKTRFWAREAARRLKMTPLEHPTIWFNAWKFNQQEQVWAALATAVLGQLTTKYGFFARLFFLGKLMLKRTDKLATINHIARKLVIPLAIAAVVALYRINRESLRPYLPIPTLSGEWSWLSSDNMVWLAPMLAAMWQAFKAIKDPFELPISELVSQPDYKGKIGFIGTFEEDFERIVEVAIGRSMFWQPRKLVIFIDDLDRCSPIQAAGIVEAINLFLDSVGCVFVLGMDMSAVAISIEVKYKELTQRMRADAPDSISPGILFLDKIVQVPFNVPRPTRDLIESLVQKITQPKTRKLPSIRYSKGEAASKNGAYPTVNLSTDRPQLAVVANTDTQVASPAPQTDRAGFAQKDVRDAIAFAATLLKENPRQVKRFINLFRLQVYIAHERKLLSDGNEFGLTPKKLGVWVAWYMQWPDILKLLSGPTDSTELLEHLQQISDLELSVKSYDDYLKKLKAIRTKQSDAVIHWSRLPWPLWVRDSDFLQSLKELRSYWTQPQLLTSLLDMTQATITTTPTPAIPDSLIAVDRADISPALSAPPA